jgi:D-alanyl-lipoteichoic acid acyltransferase DltB (MBOAT superfamily)
MSIHEILILTGIALILGLITRHWQRKNLLLISSILFMFWLQPDTSLRSLGFWLPVIALGLVIFTWIYLSSPEQRSQTNNIQTLFLALFLVLLVNLSRFIDLKGVLGFVKPAPIFQALIALSIMGGLGYLLLNSKHQSKGLIWVLFGLVLTFFIILKTPFLTYKTSQLWRYLAGQSIELAESKDIIWLGYSYLAFRLLGAIRDQQTGRLPEIDLRDFIIFIFFFPAFISGPIAQLKNILADIQQMTHSVRQNFVAAAERIIPGMFKKFVIADSLAIIALSTQNSTQPETTLGSWILLYAFSMQIYFDFSGYTDIALGLGRLMDIRLPENFNQPYLKPNLTRFWNSWHMSLTNWFRSYFFNPLSRNLRRKKYSLLVILLITQVSTMVLVGLWHGVTFNFVIWGLWHGIGLLVQNRFSAFTSQSLSPPENSPLSRLLNVGGALLTFHYVTLSWVWFILPDPESSWVFLKSLFGAAG